MEERLDVADPEDDQEGRDAALASQRQATVLRAAFNVGDDYGPSSHLPPPPLSSTRKLNMSAPTILEPKTGTGYPMNPHPVVNKAPNPTKEEPFCVVRDNIISEMLVHDAERLANPQDVLNRVVYDCIEPNPNAFKGGAGSTGGAAATTASDGTLLPYYTKTDPADTTLIFESRFESGNLRRAIQVYEYEYDLILRPDINTRGHTQWYYFRIENMIPGRMYKFNVINLTKPDSLYNYGMRPLIYSEKEASLDGTGWQRRGEDICYYQNHIKRRQGSYYSLTFKLHCKYPDDTVYAAYCYPYSYTDLQVYLHELENDPKRRNRFRRRTLCQTLAGNSCDLLTITSFACDPEALKARKGVVISGRVHPGESNASWMMKGFIDYLTGPSLDAKILRDNFVFKVVPMLNPDGVINGNYRCSLAGCDLNRQWQDPSKKLNPTIFNTKMMMKRFMEDREVVMFCDLHGHSRKKNIFMYGCDQADNSVHRLKERIFPRLLAKNSDIFSFADCNFKVQKSKDGCGRVVVARELGLLYAYTMEASFCGANFGRQCDCHFNSYDLEQMGHYFCDTILDFCDPDQSKVNAIRAELDVMYPPKKDRNRPKPTDDDSGDTSSDDVSDSGSDSGEEKKPKKKKKGGGKKRGKGGGEKSGPARKSNSAGGGAGATARPFKDALGGKGGRTTQHSSKISSQVGTPTKRQPDAVVDKDRPNSTGSMASPRRYTPLPRCPYPAGGSGSPRSMKLAGADEVAHQPSAGGPTAAQVAMHNSLQVTGGGGGSGGGGVQGSALPVLSGQGR